MPSKQQIPGKEGTVATQQSSQPDDRHSESASTQQMDLAAILQQSGRGASASRPDDLLQLQRQIGNRSVSRLQIGEAQTQKPTIQPQKPTIQRFIVEYQRGTKLRKNARVFKGLNDKQKEQVQDFHDDQDNEYTIDQARHLVGAAPLDSPSGTSSGLTPPFAFRYAPSGDSTMTTIESDSGGLVQYPKTQKMDFISSQEEFWGGGKPQMSVVSGSDYSDLPTTSKRSVTQSVVMDKVSPNEAARALGLKCPTKLSWEWLHLVAFSIRQTHIPSLSVQSMNLIKKTNQPQQIRENLVLGTAAANTAMLSYETAIKAIMKGHPLWKLSLFVVARKEDRKVKNSKGQTVFVPVATRIDYHFQFETDDDKVIPPVILAFDTMSHERPPRSEYGEVVEALKKHIALAVTVKDSIQGIDTSMMDKTDKMDVDD